MRAISNGLNNARALLFACGWPGSRLRRRGGRARAAAGRTCCTMKSRLENWSFFRQQSQAPCRGRGGGVPHSLRMAADGISDSTPASPASGLFSLLVTSSIKMSLPPKPLEWWFHTQLSGVYHGPRGGLCLSLPASSPDPCQGKMRNSLRSRHGKVHLNIQRIIWFL